ncbi:ARP2/3 complex ARPC3 subunit [Botrytis cinerea]
MPAYNSIFNEDSSTPLHLIGNFPLLPLRTKVRGPAYTLPLDPSLPAHLSPEPDSESYDALDEVRPKMEFREAQKEVQNIALDSNFAIPGEPGFPLNQMFEAPASRQEAETLRQYLGQVRQELASRLLARIYDTEDRMPSKWWLSFTKRKFMGKSL